MFYFPIQNLARAYHFEKHSGFCDHCKTQNLQGRRIKKLFMDTDRIHHFWVKITVSGVLVRKARTFLDLKQKVEKKYHF